eukprot:g574.t1
MMQEIELSVFDDDERMADPASKKSYRMNGRNQNGEKDIPVALEIVDRRKGKLSKRQARHKSSIEDEMNSKRRKWRNAMVLDTQVFCCQEFITDEEIIFKSQCATISRFVWFLFIVYMFMYILFIAQGYRTLLHSISTPVVSLNTDYAYFADMDDVNSATYWDANTQPDPTWCLGSEFYVPSIRVPDKNYLTSASSGKNRIAPFSAISACLNPMKSAEFVSSTQSPNIQIPTSIVSLKTSRTSKYATNAFDEASLEGMSGARTFANHSRAFFLTGVDFATLSIDFLADNWEGKTDAARASFDGWSPSFEVMLLNADAEIVRGCPKFPATGQNKYFTGVSAADFSVGDECVWSPSASNGGRITMNLHNVLSAAEINLNDDNAVWKDEIDTDVAATTSYNDLDGDAVEYPYRLSGVTLLMNIEIANYCAGPRTFLEADSTYDVANQFEKSCMVTSLPAQVTPTIHANITVTKIHDFGTIESLLVNQPTGSSTLEMHNGINIIVQVGGDLYTPNSYRSSHAFLNLLLLLIAFNIGIFVINSFVTSPFSCTCARATNCCNAEQEVLFWASIKEETGVDIDPKGMRFWDKECQFTDRMAHRVTSDMRLFRKLNSEPLWVTRRRQGKKTVWKNYGKREVEGDLIDVKDAISYYDELREDHGALLESDITSGRLDRVQDWLMGRHAGGGGGGSVSVASMIGNSIDLSELKIDMSRRLAAKTEGLKLLLADPAEGQNLMRCVFLEALEALQPIIARKLRVRALRSKLAYEARRMKVKKGGDDGAGASSRKSKF